MGNQVKVSLRNRVEMAIRYDANLKDVKNLVDNGVKLVWTSSHPGTVLQDALRIKASYIPSTEQAEQLTASDTHRLRTS